MIQLIDIPDSRLAGEEMTLRSRNPAPSSVRLLYASRVQPHQCCQDRLIGHDVDVCSIGHLEQIDWESVMFADQDESSDGRHERRSAMVIPSSLLPSQWLAPFLSTGILVAE